MPSRASTPPRCRIVTDCCSMMRSVARSLCAARTSAACATVVKTNASPCAVSAQEGQLKLQGVQQPLHVSRQYAFNCDKLPVEVFFIGGDLGSGGSSVSPGELPSISCEFAELPRCLPTLRLYLRVFALRLQQTCFTRSTSEQMGTKARHQPHSVTHASTTCKFTGGTRLPLPGLTSPAEP